MRRLTRDGTAEFSRDQVFRRKRGQGNITVPRSVDHEQDRQFYPVDPYYINTYLLRCPAVFHLKGRRLSN